MDALFIGIGMGLAYAAAPGPLNVESIRRVLHQGRHAAIALQLGAVLGDGVLALGALIGLGMLVLQPAVHLLLGLIGAGLLLFLGLTSLHTAWQWRTRSHLSLAQHQQMHEAGRRGGMLRSAQVGCLMALANPLGVALWLSLCGSALYQTHHSGGVFLTGFFLSLVLWAIGLPLLLGWSWSLLRGRFFDQVPTVCGISLLAFGVALGYTVLAV